MLIVVGAAAIYGGNFGRDNVTDRLAPEQVRFPAYEAMTPEKREVGDFAGQQVVNGQQAEAYARYIGGHLALINEGKTYSETSAAAREEGIDPGGRCRAPRRRPTRCSRARPCARSC